MATDADYMAARRASPTITFGILMTTTMDLLGLLWRVDHALGKLSRQMLGRFGVTSPQRLALRLLLRAPETTAAGVAELLSVDRSSVSGILQRMEDVGLVERTPNETDARKQRILVTEAGRAVDALRHGTVEAAMHRTLEGLTTAEIGTVRLFLTRFAAELERERHELGETEAAR